MYIIVYGQAILSYPNTAALFFTIRKHIQYIPSESPQAGWLLLLLKNPFVIQPAKATCRDHPAQWNWPGRYWGFS